MGKRGPKPTGNSGSMKDQIRPFIKEIETLIEDLDWAIRMYSITLEEYGVEEKEIERKIQEVFWSKVKNMERGNV